VVWVRRLLKLIGIVIGLIGAVAALANLLGCFRDAQKQEFARIVIGMQDEIPSSTPGFKLFLRAFPPPSGTNPSEVTAIADKTLRYNSRSDVGGSVSYVARGERSPPVAHFAQVEDWARSTVYGWIGWVISTIGWALYAILELTEPRARAT
jgi:hypothetical protein